MQTKILAKCADVAKRHGVKLLFAVESGSRSWGFHSDNSDYDVRFVYTRPESWYVSIFNDKRDVIECGVDQDLLDVSGWDLKKLLYQIYKGNPQLAEWLRSPIVYLQSGGILEELRRLSDDFMNPATASYHYRHLAGNHWHSYIQGRDLAERKKYLYVLRGYIAAEHVFQHHSFPPVLFDELRAGVNLNMPKDAIDELIAQKRAGEELGMMPPVPALDRFIDECRSRWEERKGLFKVRCKASDPLDEFLLRHLWTE